jgi:hypothetical protein
MWYVHNELHREDGPAIEYADGGKEWYLHGKRHREGAPAIEHASGTKMWYLHDKRHREDGPAVEYASGTKSWWLHDKEYEATEAWAEALLKERNKPHDAAAIDAFLKPMLRKDIEMAL